MFDAIAFDVIYTIGISHVAAGPESTFPAITHPKAT